jgi:hypothetical protein
MSFFRRAFEKATDVGGTAVGQISSLRLDPTRLRGAGRGLRNLVTNIPYIFNLTDRDPFAPEGLDLSEIRTDAQARDAIDSIIGIDDVARKKAEAISYYRDQGGFTRRIELLLPPGAAPVEPSLQGLPFSLDSDARLAVGDFQFDPTFVLDQQLAKQLEDPAVFMQYMRMTEPQTLVANLVERDLNKMGQDESVLRNITGNPFGTAWDAFSGLFTGETVERIEEVIGQGYYQNAIPDPYLRQVFATRLWDFSLFNFWDWERQNERGAMQEVERIMADGLTGEAAADELERYFQENPLGAAGFTANMLGWVAMDPLNFVPVGWVAKPVTIPLKAVTKGAPISRFLRLFTPTGRRVAFSKSGITGLFKLESYKALTRMPEASYAAQRITEPVKGISRLLFEKPANLFADSVAVTLERRLKPIKAALAREPARISEIGETFKTGKPTRWVADNLPGLRETNDDMLDFGARIAEKQSDVFDDALKEMTSTIDDWTEAGFYRAEATVDDVQQAMVRGETLIARADLEQAIPEYVVAKARSFAETTQRDLWNATKFGRFLSRWYFPMTGMIKGVTAAVTINNPGFVWLNVVSNAIRLSWHSAFHPAEGFKAMAYAFSMESSVVLKGGGRAPRIWNRMARVVGIDPIDIERFATRITGSHDLLSRSLFEAGQEGFEDSLKLIQKARLQPAKEIGQRRRFWDPVMAPVHIAGRVDKIFRRATFYSQLQRQYHMALAPGGKIRGLFAPVGEAMETAGRGADEIRRAENAFADEIGLYLFGNRELPEGVSDLGEVIVPALQGRLDRMEAGVASGVLSPHDYGRRFAREVLKHEGQEAELFATHDLAPIMDFISSDVMPVLDDAQKVGTGEAMTKAMKRIDRMLETYALDYDVPSDIVRQMARQPSVMRGPTTYAGALRVTDQAIRRELADNVQLLDRFISIVKPGWSPKEQTSWYASRQWARVAESATTENIKRLDAIRAIYNDLAREGVERVSRDTIIPPRLLEALPEDIRPVTKPVTLPPARAAPVEVPAEVARLEADVAARQADVKRLRLLAAGEESGTGPIHQALQDAQARAKGVGMRLSAARKAAGISPAEAALAPAPVVPGKKVKAANVGDLWDGYLTRRDASFDEMFSFVDDTVRKSSEAHADIVARIGEHVKKTFAEHRRIISEALEVGDDDAWRVAGEKVRQLYEQSAPRKAKIAGLGVNDVPAAQQFMDPSGVLASEIHEFKGFFMRSLRDDIPKLLRGDLAVESEAVRAMRATIGDVQRGWAEVRDIMIGNSRAATDFVMLNYLDQRGIDRIAQSVFPFEFWPTRDAMHWAIRGARAPGAFGAITIAMFESQKFSEQYGYPQRLQYRIPIPLPGLSEFLNKMPGVGSLLEGGDFAPVYFIDPLRFVFPYTFLRDQFDDEARRNTLPGRVLDFFQNSTPLNVGPFQKFAFRHSGMLDKDAWRSTVLSGGPFGLPMTPLARATARFVFTGDTDAIPADEQRLYVEKGHFSPGWLRDLLGMEDDQWAVWRADRAMASLVTTGELIPGASKEEQLEKAWIALDTRAGPEWKKAVKASQAETNLRRLTYWIGFPFGDVVGVNEGERIWFGLKAIYGEYSRRGKLDEFFEKYPEFELRTATVRGLSDPEEREKAVDTELYWQSIDQYVEKPFEKAVMDLENERSRLQELTQSQPVRDQLAVLRDELRAIRDEQEKRREELDRAFPFRAKELSINRNPRGRALAGIRNEWFDIERGEGEDFDAFLFRREEFLSQFPTVTDTIAYEDMWQQIETQFMQTRIVASRQRDLAFQKDDFDEAQRIADARDTALEELHEQARQVIARRDVERFLATFAWPKTEAQQEFETADSLKDLWFSLTSSGSPFTRSERGAISAYFRSMPVIQKYFPVEALDLADLSLEQRFALMRRKDFWSTYFSIRDNRTQVDYARMMKPELDEANRLLGLPPLEIIDIEPYPVESSGDPLFSHIQMMAAINRREDIDEDEQLTEEEREELERLMAEVGLAEADTALTDADVSRFLRPYSVEDTESP